MSDIDIAAEDLGTAWALTLLAVARSPGRRAFHTVTRIADLTAENPPIREVAERLLELTELAGVRTVANTIFPAAMADHEPDPVKLGVRYLRLLPTLKGLDRRNVKGTYFQRLVAYPGPSGKTVNQLAELARRLRVELRTTGPKSARYEVGVDTPGIAVPTFEAERDTSAMAFPCLSLLSFQLEGGARLSAVAHYRSQYLLQRGYGNYAGIANLVSYVANIAQVMPGRLAVVAGYAHADHMNRTREAMVEAALGRA